MSYYGGTITVDGRNLITSLVAGETIEFTRIVVGSGQMPEGVEPIDMKDLVAPVAEATSTTPTVDNGVLYMTVEYRNDMNGGLAEGFWLREFGIYAKTDKSGEVLLYYATLGDSPQPVNAYQDNRIDIRRYPVSIELELDADVQVTYNPGAFITAAEAQELIGSMVNSAIGALGNIGSAIITSITLPADGWVWQEVDDQDMIDGTEEYNLVLDVACADALEEQFPSLALDKSSLNIAKRAGLCPTIQALDGVLRFWAKSQPDKDMSGTLALLSPSGGASGGGGSYVLPVATSTTLGGVRVQEGSGLTIDSKGNIAIDAATAQEAEDLYNASQTDTSQG